MVGFGGVDDSQAGSLRYSRLLIGGEGKQFATCSGEVVPEFAFMTQAGGEIGCVREVLG